MLFTQKSEVDIHEMSPLALAFVGDAVLELLVRARLVGTTRLQPNRLHTVATHYVSAHAQNLELDSIEPMLTDAEAAVLRRGKNASKATVAKHATVQEYRASTGFECLLGWLYLQGKNDRIEELSTRCGTGISRSNKKKAFPRGGRWPRPRPRADEGKASAICPVTGCSGKAAPHQPPAGGSFPPRGEALGNPPHL